jgi:hypothetical protein
MMRDIFRRGVRMVHRFGTLEERVEPWGAHTFEPHIPERVDELSGTGRSCEVQEYGEHSYREPSSAVVKPSGATASINGPSPDLPQILAMPIPVGTKRRHGPVKTDK